MKSPLPLESAAEYSPRMLASDYTFEEARSFAFAKPNGSKTIAYWVPKNMLTETYEGTVSFRVPKAEVQGDIRLVNLLDGSVYALPKNMVVEEDETIKLSHLPVLDSPLLLTFGNFCMENE